MEQIFGDLVQFASHCKANFKVRSGCLQLFLFLILLCISKKILALSLFCLFHWKYRTLYLFLVSFVGLLSARLSILLRSFWFIFQLFIPVLMGWPVSLYCVASKVTRWVFLKTISGHWRRRMGTARKDLSKANYTWPTWLPFMMKWLDLWMRGEHQLPSTLTFTRFSAWSPAAFLVSVLGCCSAPL